MKRITMLLLSGALFLWAGDSWRNKAPEDWNPSDVERLIEDSPWARDAAVSFTGAGGAPIGSPGRGRSGGVGFPGGGVGFPGGGGLPDGGWGGPFMVRSNYDAFDHDGIVRWRSALPIRLAFARTPGGDAIEADAFERFYIVEVSSLPAAMAHNADEPERLRQVSRLVVKGRSPIRARLIDIRPQPGAPGVLLYFPRDQSITLDDKTVEFEMTPDDFELRSKFKLKEMEFDGRLEL